MMIFFKPSLKRPISVSLFGTFIAVTFFFAFGCAPTWVHAPAPPDYYLTSEPIPLTIGIVIDEQPFSAQWWGDSKIRQDYGPEIVEYLKKMKVFKKIVFPYVKDDTVEAVFYLSVKGRWSYDNKGRSLVSLFAATPDYNDFVGEHDVKVVLKTVNDELDDFRLPVIIKGQYSGTNNDQVTKELNDMQIKRIAIDIANRCNNDRKLIIDRLSRNGKLEIKQGAKPHLDSMSVKTDVEKLDKLRQSGLLSEDEYKRAKNRIVSGKTVVPEAGGKIQELDDLLRNGILSEEEYSKAKKRHDDLQKLDELHKSRVLSEEEYSKARARLLEK